MRNRLVRVCAQRPDGRSYLCSQDNFAKLNLQSLLALSRVIGAHLHTPPPERFEAQ